MGRQRATQRTIGEILGISQPQVSKRLLAEHPFNTRELDKLADAWGVPVERLLPVGQPVSAES
jgi:transcriptional regulator with XRE-family HTH domain